jgi:hypothetical protein
VQDGINIAKPVAAYARKNKVVFFDRGWLGRLTKY